MPANTATRHRLAMAGALALMIALYLISALPAPSPPSQFPPRPAWMSWSLLNNLLHIPAYGLLSWLFFHSLVRVARPGRAALMAAIGATGYGILMELVQIDVPGRYASVDDVYLNAFGAALGAALAHHRLRRRQSGLM